MLMAVENGTTVGNAEWAYFAGMIDDQVRCTHNDDPLSAFCCGAVCHPQLLSFPRFAALPRAFFRCRFV